jgi:hypothetical protein
MRVLFALILVVIMLMPATTAFAGAGPAMPDGGPKMGPDGYTGPTDPAPIAIKGPRLKPPVIPHTLVGDIYNNVVASGLPAQSLEADAADGGARQSKPGKGVKETITGLGAGLTLYASPNVCNDFNSFPSWAASDGDTDIWTDWFAGWAPFAIDNGYYQAKNTQFSMERAVGPGSNYAKDQNSVKIASNQPYAGGFGSPIIPVPAGFEGGKVLVSVKYLIWDHDTGGTFSKDGWDYDWASMGIKPDAYGDHASYVNGYVRGEWAELTHTVDLGHATTVMVLLQGHSPAALNSNIYFDDVKIAFIDAQGNGKYLRDCTTAESVK